MAVTKTGGAFEFDHAVTQTFSSTFVPSSGSGTAVAKGTYREEDGKGYRFVLFNNGAGNVAAVSGNLAYIRSASDPWDVTMDVSDSDRNLVCGVFLSVPADLGYCWIQTKGYHATVKTNADDDIAKGDAIIASAAGDGTADSTAQDTAPICRVVGWAMAADVDADDTVATFLTLES